MENTIANIRILGVVSLVHGVVYKKNNNIKIKSK
jgi:hypothetical protein